MLGWEYPPFINGGLGIACAGLCNALAEYAEITLIVPKISEAQKNEKIRAIGLNKIDQEEFEQFEIEEIIKESIEVHKIDVQLDPYTFPEKPPKEKKITRRYTEKIVKKKIEKVKNALNFDDLYGNDVIGKVVLYADLVKNISSKLQFDIIHAHDWMTSLAGLDVKKMTGKPLVLHVHSLDYDRAGGDSRSWIFETEKNALFNADLIIPVSNYTASILQSHYGIHGIPVMTVHNGIEIEAPEKKEKPFPEKMVLFIGRLTGQKGPEYFLEIATRIYKKYKNVRFVIAGTGEKLVHLLEDGAYRQIGSRVHFTGFLGREKIKDLLAIADVYCMPSVSEPFGLTALEAAQYQIPTVISERSGVAEVLTGSLKADFWDIDLMVKQITDLLSNDKLKEKVVKQNNEDLKSLTWQNAAKKVADAYQDLLSRQSLKIMHDDPSSFDA